MTTVQLHAMNAIYLVVFVLVAVFTRATPRRIAGAFAGGAVFAVVAIGIIAIGEGISWWHMSIRWEPGFLVLLWLDFALGGFVYLLTWRLARKFRWRGLAVVIAILAVLGPIRDYRLMERMPAWGSYSPGLAPILAVSATYILFIVIGHGVMRLVAGPADEDALARTARAV